MEITINFQLTTLIIGTLLGLGLSYFIQFLRVKKRKRKRMDHFQTIEIVPKQQLRLTDNHLNLSREKYANSTLSNKDKEKIISSLLTCMDKEKVYQKANLTLAQLAKKINIPKHQLSQVINEKIALTFIDFVNQYRVQEAQEKFKNMDYKNIDLIKIGQQAGFNSKSTFYAVFKKHTGTTPGEYRKNIQAKTSLEVGQK